MMFNSCSKVKRLTSEFSALPKHRRTEMGSMETMIAMKVVGFSFQFIAGKLERMLAEEAAMLAGVEDDVRYMVDELKSMTSFLKAMSTRHNLDDQLQNWVQEVKEAAYDAEDLIDEFSCHLGSIPYDQRRVKGFFKHFLRSIKSMKARHDIASDLKKLKVHVEEEVRKRHDRYSLLNEATSSGIATSLEMAGTYSDPRIIGHFVEEAQLVGINESRHTLIEWVLDKNRLVLTVISLVGFGGLGKTTLAKTVYDDPIIVGGHFQPRAWISVSQNYNIKELRKKIIRQISVNEQQIRDVIGCQDARLNTEQLLNMMDETQLMETIRDHLQGKRYLLVFDDVWRTEAWEGLSTALPPGKEGSRVIVTTRIEEVANTSCSELENVGREILQKGNGLPLAIVTIAGLLASRPDKKLEEWKDLRDHLRLEIETNDKLLKIHQILVLSYNDLPYHLKPCFLFLGTFPEDFEIHRKRLMRRWIAEGIVSGEGGLPAEKVAERYFNQLVNRSLVQPSQFDDSGTVKSCRVHDMMLDVILSISSKENFAVILNEHTTIPPQHQKIRRLSWHGGNSGVVPDPYLSRLRSFTAFGVDVQPPIDYRKQRQLRAIDLEGCRALHYLHPKCFSKSFLLKYLSLRNTGLSELPDSIGDLQNLEFLDIRGTQIYYKLPKTIVKLQKLVYLLASNYLKVPKRIEKLKRLVTFGIAYVENVQSLQEIGELVDLQKLGIGFRQHDDLSLRMQEISALFSKLIGSLRSLKIFSWPNSGLKTALDQVASPPLMLCKLGIHFKLGELPPWFASLNHVVKISLSNTLLQLEDLQVLRNLPALVNLILGYRSFVHYDLVFDRGGFTQLKFLEISWYNVSFKEGAVRSLEILKIFFVTGVRSVNGIEHLHRLREVHIKTRDEEIIEMVKNISASHSNRLKCFATQH
ncbi:disease resistance protein Pik-2-like [Zingiber officinale]|uniref:disease resistance protein Pik-2-like n=1 Tax=Zingiber officinale TaxID=94328 RepID=UPI001C4AEB0A|nr:disease resistance protein Pik-2-like [Zingiber officinale]